LLGKSNPFCDFSISQFKILGRVNGFKLYQGKKMSEKHVDKRTGKATFSKSMVVATAFGSDAFGSSLRF